jgi:hypothetical protein
LEAQQHRLEVSSVNLNNNSNPHKAAFLETLQLRHNLVVSLVVRNSRTQEAPVCLDSPSSNNNKMQVEA